MNHYLYNLMQIAFDAGHKRGYGEHVPGSLKYEELVEQNFEKWMKGNKPMITKYDISFSVNRYDGDGDIYEEGIYLHFGDDVSIRFADSIEDFNNKLKRLRNIRDEIIETYVPSTINMEKTQ